MKCYPAVAIVVMFLNQAYQLVPFHQTLEHFVVLVYYHDFGLSLVMERLLLVKEKLLLVME